MTAHLPLKGRTALITGASRGLGRAIAVKLARDGAHVIITARTPGALEEVDDEVRKAGGSATLIQLDLKNADRIDQIGPTLYQRWGKLDIFVGNGAILGPLSPLPHVTADAWDMVMAVNLTANWRLIRTLDPLLRLSDAGRVILVSSAAADARHAYWGPYAVSKAGLEALGKTYAKEVENSTIRVNVVDPGRMRTAMRAKAFPGEDPNTLPTPADVAPMFAELSRPTCTVNGEVIAYRTWKEKREGAASAAETAD